MIVNWAGIIIGFGSIFLGNYLEGGHIESLIQPTAALIVFGGTLGACLVASTKEEFMGAITKGISSFTAGDPNHKALVKEIVDMATVARKDGLLALEGSVGKIKNKFLAKNMRSVIDGYDANVLKEIMEDEMHHTEDMKNMVGKVWETAGGFSPTVGILGAVLGLIHVMNNLSDSSKLGSGIAVAFVATVYGVGSANLVFIPLGNKIKKDAKKEMLEMQIVFLGVTGIQEGLNPRIIQDRLTNLVGDHGGHDKDHKKAA